MKRPTVVEFSGLPNSGKTTLLNNLKERLEGDGLSTSIVREQAELLPSIIPKDSIEKNLWITLQTLQRSMEVSFLSDVDYVFFDRGFYDQYFWVELYGEKDKEYSRFALGIMDEFARRYQIKPDYMYVVDVDVDESIKRRMATGEPVTFSKKDFLVNYQTKFAEFAKKLDNTLYINTTGLEKDEVADIVFNQIITL